MYARERICCANTVRLVFLSLHGRISTIWPVCITAPAESRAPDSVLYPALFQPDAIWRPSKVCFQSKNFVQTLYFDSSMIRPDAIWRWQMIFYGQIWTDWIARDFSWHVSEFVVLNRPDRNEYLDVFMDNVNPKKLDQFEIPASKSLVELDPTIPYDYNSIMHYGKYYFAKKDAKVSYVVQREDLQLLDGNALYKNDLSLSFFLSNQNRAVFWVLACVQRNHATQTWLDLWEPSAFMMPSNHWLFDSKAFER